MKKSGKRIFITGIAGFIGFHLARFLKRRGDFVSGCDNFNDYYDPNLKFDRARILKEEGIEVFDIDIEEKKVLEAAILKLDTEHIIHLAAQAGVRYSIQNPKVYQAVNSNGFFHILEILRNHPQIRLTFASSSSVYGLNKKIPFSEKDPTDQPANFYGATKKSNELMAFSYSKLYGVKAVGLRFFTVYGPYGRPDMAYYLFTKAILEKRPIKLFNDGNMQRDFTYIDDIVKGTAAAIDYEADFEIFNLGNHKPEELRKMIQLIEDFTGQKAIIEKLPMPKGEIQITYADISKAEKFLYFSPTTTLENGMEKFLTWYAPTIVSN